MPLAEALLDLQELTRRLRRDCPWDREQTSKTIVPHTVEEAYEVADAALAGDDAKLLDELGDLLFQTVFLALLLEERDAGSLEAVATARGVSYDEVKAAVLAAVQADLDTAVAEGNIEQERADEVLERVTTWLDDGGELRRVRGFDEDDAGA